MAPGAGLRELLDKALQLETEAQQLLRQGDLAGYQRKQQEQTEILRQMRNMAR
jgi:molybdate-binding protein